MTRHCPAGRDTSNPASGWLRAQLDREVDCSVHTLLGAMTERLSIAAGSAATLRRLSADGEWLSPVAAHHPDPGMTAAMTAIMEETAPRARSGLWRPVVEERRAVRYRVDPGSTPAEASDEQARFLDRFPVTAVLGVPVEHDGRLVGGTALVRYSVPRPFDDADEALLVDFAARAGVVLAMLEEYTTLHTSDG
ncbi:GAF domain-containing protein [Pseudonocardia alni]|uniref:GAF domain-containing protein n=1 Tax=Pseudonocardia alni TaxID=33907 RepID=UPI003317A96C